MAVSANWLGEPGEELSIVGFAIMFRTDRQQEMPIRIDAPITRRVEGAHLLEAAIGQHPCLIGEQFRDRIIREVKGSDMPGGGLNPYPGPDDDRTLTEAATRCIE